MSARRLRDGSWEVINEDGTRSIVWGVASTGQVANEGTAELVDHADGSRDAIVRPQPVNTRAAAGDFVKETLEVDLSELEKQLHRALVEGKVRYKRLSDGRALVDFDDFKRWVNGL